MPDTSTTSLSRFNDKMKSSITKQGTYVLTNSRLNPDLIVAEIKAADSPQALYAIIDKIVQD